VVVVGSVVVVVVDEVVVGFGDPPTLMVWTSAINPPTTYE
jgi:hypothetical protein